LHHGFNRNAGQAGASQIRFIDADAVHDHDLVVIGCAAETSQVQRIVSTTIGILTPWHAQDAHDGIVNSQCARALNVLGGNDTGAEGLGFARPSHTAGRDHHFIEGIGGLGLCERRRSSSHSQRKHRKAYRRNTRFHGINIQQNALTSFPASA
jgi:hypothetical protein